MRASLDNEYVQEREYSILPADRLGIRGLHMFGHAEFGRAVQALDEHYHPGCMEIVALVEGHQRYTVGGEEHELYGGDVFTTFVEEVHGTGQDPQTVSELLWFQMDLREAKHFLELAPPWDARLLERLQNWNRRTIRMEMDKINLLKQAFRCFAAGPNQFRQISYGHSLLLAFLNSMLETETTPSKLSPDMQRVVDLIDQRLSEPLEMETLAQAVGLSTSWLKAKFRDQVGMAPREFINRAKVEKAKELLKEGESSMTEIAYKLGFNNSSYFAAVFRQFAGISPRAYQKKHRNTE